MKKFILNLHGDKFVFNNASQAAVVLQALTDAVYVKSEYFYDNNNMFVTRPDYCSANNEAVRLTKETGVTHVVEIRSYLYIIKPVNGEA